MIYRVAIDGYSNTVTSGLYADEESARQFAQEHTQKHGVPTIVFMEIDICRPLPHPIEWDSEK